MYQYKGSDKPSAVERAMEQIIGYISDQGLGTGSASPPSGSWRSCWGWGGAPCGRPCSG